MEALYRKVWKGDFIVNTEDMGIMVMGKRGVSFTVHPHDGEDGSQGLAFSNFSFNFTEEHFMKNLQILHMEELGHSDMVFSKSNVKAFQEHTSESMKQALYRQVLHHILRQHGAKINAKDVKLLSEHLLCSYRRESEHAYKYALVVAVARLDSTLSSRMAAGYKLVDVHSEKDVDFLTESYLDIGPLFEACAKYQVAGELFVAIGDMLCQTRKKFAAGFYQDAMQSFVRAKNFAEARNLFPKVRQTALDNKLIDISNSQLLDSYSQCYARLGEDNPQLKSKIVLTYHTYIALLAVGMNYKCQEEVTPVKEFTKVMLQPKYKTTKGANQFLVKLYREARSGEDLQDSILSCLSDKVDIDAYSYSRLQQERLALKSFEEHKAGVKQRKVHARQRVDKEKLNLCRECNSAEIVNLHKNEKPKYLYCPCQSDCYCGKECQLKAWKVHKKFCAHHQARKERKKSTGDQKK